MLGLLVQLVAFALFPLIREPWHAYALFSLDGIGAACFWPGQSTLLSRLTPPEARHSAYALQRVTSLGVGLGARSAADRDDRRSEQLHRLFLIDAATFLVFADPAGLRREPPVTEAEEHEEPGTYRMVLRDRNFLAFIGLNVLFVAVGYEVFALLPPFAKNYAGVSERWVGFIWLANTLLIVLIQLPVAKALEGRRRMAALALMNVIWATAALSSGGRPLADRHLRRRSSSSSRSSSSASARPCRARRRRRSSSTWPPNGCGAATSR